MTPLARRFQEGRVLLDGGMGTMLLARGLALGRPPEEWNLTHAAIVRDVHASYLEAGAEVVTTNTFGATPSRMASYGLDERTDDINRAALELAREAVEKHRQGARGEDPVAGEPKRRFVALSIGPTGKMFPPVGKADEGEIGAEFERQLSAIDSRCDLVLIETMYDLREALVALRAAKQSVTVPVGVTLTFTKNPRGFFTIMGNEAASATRALVDAGADLAGANCTLASAGMLELARVLRGSTDAPILCQPNAGQPRVKDGVPVYDQTPEDFAQDAMDLFATGINAVGGCCGTTPEFIKEVYVRLHKQ